VKKYNGRLVLSVHAICLFALGRERISRKTQADLCDAEPTMPEAYTVSKMLSSINEVMAPVATDVCGSVTLQRKTENGIMLNTSEKEIAYLDTKAKVKHSAQQVAQLDKPAKSRWVAAQRLAGNDAFHNGGYKQAADAYIQALTALDFGSTTHEKIACQQELQVPLTCNLAACMLMLEVSPTQVGCCCFDLPTRLSSHQQQWDKARLMCDQVLALDPNCVKALQQRAKAKAKLCQFDEARYGRPGLKPQGCCF
jgi:tetratricopeptide (TPR) repeat protein